jgi:predicted DCC family thiol-disulfide oxidoreductase YuxK
MNGVANGPPGAASPAARPAAVPPAGASRTDALDAGAAATERSDVVADGPLILYDGQCGLCHRSVRWLIKRDQGRLRYAPLQGPTTAALRRRFPDIPETLESVVLVDGGRVFLRSKAFLHSARYLMRPWRWGYALRWLPAALLDPAYRVVAHYRYRWFGHYDECQLPSAEERHRLLP